MLRIVAATHAAGVKRYFAAADYYSEGRETVGIWGGTLAAELGLEGAVDPADFAALVDNLHPQTGERLTQRTRDYRRIGYDMVISVPKGLASLGTTIPMPAFPICMTAALAVRLGNMYGYSYEAQPAASRVLDGLSQERWESYLNECLPGDTMILEKLAWYESPARRWCELVRQFDLEEREYKSKKVGNLVMKATESNLANVKAIANDLLRQYGS